MRVKDINLKEKYLRKEAPARFNKRIWGGGADINEGYVLGLRFKTAPVFHFLGKRKAQKKALVLHDLPHAGKSRAYGCYGTTAAMGGDV